MSVSQIGVLVQFTTGSNAVADLNANIAAIRTQFNNLITATDTLAGGLTLGSLGNVGIGGAPSASQALTTSGVTTSGVDQRGVSVQGTFSSAATTAGKGIYASVATQAAAFTMVSGYGIQIDAPTIGAGSAITTLYGLRIENQTGGGTNYAIYTNTGPVRFGDTVTVVGAFGCNAKTAQTAVVAGAAAPAGGTGVAAGGWSLAADRDTAIAMINQMRTALIANGIMS